MMENSSSNSERPRGALRAIRLKAIAWVVPSVLIFCIVFGWLAFQVQRAQQKLGKVEQEVMVLRRERATLSLDVDRLRPERDQLRAQNSGLIGDIERSRKELAELKRTTDILRESAKNESPDVVKEKVLLALGAQNPKQRAKALYAAGMIADDRHDRSRAESFYAAAVAEYPAYAEALNALGLAVARRGDQKHATEYYSRAIAADPKYIYPIHNLAMQYFFQKNLPKARELNQQALAVDPTFKPAKDLSAMIDKAMGTEP